MKSSFNKPKLSQSIIINMLFVILMSVGIIGSLQIRGEYMQLSKDLNTMREKFLYSYNDLLKTEVSKVISYIEYHKSLLNHRLNQSIKDRVYEVHAVASNIFFEYQDTKTRSEIEKMIKDALRPIRFNNGRGYYFAFDLEGVEQLFADRPEMEGKNMLVVQGAKGEYVVRDMLDVVKKDKEGFYEYTWTKPNQSGHYSKRAYVKLFEPLGWVFGTGEYIDDVERDIQKEIIIFIDQIRFGKDGYIFACQWDGISLSGPAKGKNMWEVTDSQGLKVVQEMVRIAKSGSGYLEYIMPKLEDKKQAPKQSYVVGIPEWQWYIGAGIYIDEIQKSVELKKVESKREITFQILNIALTLGFLVCSIFFVALYISRKTRINLQAFTAFFEKASSELVEINPDEMDFAELESLAHSANKMVNSRKRLEEEREMLQNQLLHVQKIESVGRLAGGVAHDFNNMLSVILGYAELALYKIDEDHELFKPISEIRNAAERSSNLTRQLLAFARKQAINPIVLDINQTIEGMLQMLKRLIGEDIELVWLPDTNLWKVKIDPSQIDQIMANLCVNARDAITDIGKVIIETRNAVLDEKYCSAHTGYSPGDYVCIVVSDDGSGMDKSTIEKIFEPFFTTKGVGEGTGLGLATVYGIVRQNNGFINVYSEYGKGSSFTIYLPRHSGHESDPTVLDIMEISDNNKETILVVDDEVAILDISKDILETYGYTVLIAESPEKALSLVEEYCGIINLLVTDVIMPEKNGRELAQIIKGKFPEIKCLFMSGYTYSVISHRGVIDEGVQFIQKPFSMNGLAVKVREVLDNAISANIHKIKERIRRSGNSSLIGLTGGIASGKTTVAEMFKECGEKIGTNSVKLIDFDILARKVVEPNTQGFKDIVTCFGSGILDKNGYLDRKALSKIVFNDKEKRNELEKLIHPAITELFCQEVEKASLENENTTIIAVIPLLIEKNFQTLFEQIIVVYVSSEIQLQRLMNRDNIDDKRANDIIKSQLPIEYKKAYADFLIDNSGELENTRKQVQEVWEQLLSK